MSVTAQGRHPRAPHWGGGPSPGGRAGPQTARSAQAARRPIRLQRLSGHGPWHETNARRRAKGSQALFLDLELANFFTQKVDIGKITHGVALPTKRFHRFVINGRLVFLVAEMQQARTLCDSHNGARRPRRGGSRLPIADGLERRSSPAFDAASGACTVWLSRFLRFASLIVTTDCDTSVQSDGLLLHAAVLFTLCKLR
jgi:hypothetical protein